MARRNPWEVSIFPERGNGRSSIYTPPQRKSSSWSHTTHIRGVSPSGSPRPWEIKAFPERFPSSYYSSISSVTPGGPGDFSTSTPSVMRPLSSLDQSGGAGFPLDSPPRSNRSRRRADASKTEAARSASPSEDEICFLGNWEARLRTPVSRKKSRPLSERSSFKHPYTGIPKADRDYDVYHAKDTKSTEDLFGDDYFAQIERERPEKKDDDTLLSEAKALLEKSQLADQDDEDDKGSPHNDYEDLRSQEATDEDDFEKETNEALDHLESHDHLETISQFSARMRAAGKKAHLPEDDEGSAGLWSTTKPSLSTGPLSRSGSQLSPYKPESTDELTDRIARLRDWESIAHLTPRQQHLASLGLLNGKGNRTDFTKK